MDDYGIFLSYDSWFSRCCNIEASQRFDSRNLQLLEIFEHAIKLRYQPCSFRISWVSICDGWMAEANFGPWQRKTPTLKLQCHCKSSWARWCTSFFGIRCSLEWYVVSMILSVKICWSYAVIHLKKAVKASGVHVSPLKSRVKNADKYGVNMDSTTVQIRWILGISRVFRPHR